MSADDGDKRTENAAPRGQIASDKTSDDQGDELALDGVRYVDLSLKGGILRLGSVSARWREELPLLRERPDDSRLLVERGLWAGRGNRPSLAVLCCGLGSAWPHMGRELYDNFPAARAGMERIAAAADWDVLALLDEADPEKISHTRWQQPYLFLLEYGQWSQLTSLGLVPDMFCGHSLGELIALCLAGVYTPEVAWYILDTRAMHMAEMEERSTRENGMMAVHAGAEVIALARERWPALLVSNYNSPRQFILSGPREALTEARNYLRKQRVPAIVLNVSLAYHHPGMRILHDLSLRRLNGLPMNAPAVNVLSNVTADFYPPDQPSVCRLIAELDESPVRWTDCVRVMFEKLGIGHFLEIGPQDTLCGLVADNEERAVCLPVGRKGRETEQMRQVCARLYALGCLPRAAVREARRARSCPGSLAAQRHGAGQREERTQREAASPRIMDSRFAARMGELARILAAAAACPPESIGSETDLRYDLALRSSRFPALLQEIERECGVRLRFENLLGVTCVGDLARAVCAADAASSAGEGGDGDEGPETAVPEEGAASAARTGGPRLFVRTPQRFIERPDVSRLVFLEVEPDGLPSEGGRSARHIEGFCHFSRFADHALDTRALETNVPNLPVSRALQALAEISSLLFPELACYGFSDVRFLDAPLLPPGVTRECGLSAKAQARFAHDGLMTQMCRAALRARDIAPNGRRLNTESGVINATVHMTAGPYAAPPLWPSAAGDCSPAAETGFDVRSGGGESGEDIDMAAFYNTLGLSASWRLLAERQPLGGKVFRFVLSESALRQAVGATVDENIAQKEKCGYAGITCVVEAIVQAALSALGVDARALRVGLRDWRLNAAGFVIFNTLKPEARHVQVRESWSDGTTKRFDAQATDAWGRVLVALHHLEFARVAS
ncbi:MAG: acyltransferase domain-containing protein [Desulfovibrio sp.]|jgi:malonyl CoA-acyl carrier protein transacylase|nr:acyltransferase domain-containing protein [Desulfovibrio sp.]